MRIRNSIFICVAFSIFAAVNASAQSPPAQAFDNVIIHTANGQTIEGGTIVWRDGIIEAIGQDITIPFDAYVRDGGDSLHVYPGFIDGMSLWGSPDSKVSSETPDQPGNPGYKRAGIQPQRHPADLLKKDSEALKEASKIGFTTAALGLKGQMLPGQVDLFFINGEKTQEGLLERGIGMLAQFKEAKGAAYPSTTMALMARFRQLFYDARAQQQQQKYFASAAGSYPAPSNEQPLKALYPVMEQQQPFYFVADSKENIERMFWLQDELGFDVILVSGKEAHEKADELKARNIPVLASIELPEKPEWMVEDEDEEEKEKKKKIEVTEEMRIFRDRQEEAYRTDIENIKKLKEAGIRVGFASNGLKPEDFIKNLIVLKEEGGLSKRSILSMLTQSTANIIGYGQRIGNLKSGRIASFTVFDQPFLEEEAKSIYSVTNGEVTEIESESSNK